MVVGIGMALALALGAQRARADDDGTLEADRPDFSDSAVTLPRGVLQLEAGAQRTHEDGAVADELGQALIRYGLADAFELRFDAGSVVRQRDGSGWDGGSLGFKLRLREGEGKSPTIALLGDVQTAWGDARVSPRVWQPELRVAASFEPAEHWGSDVNVAWARVAADSGATFDQTAWSMTASRELGHGVALGAEYYGFSAERLGGGVAQGVDASAVWRVAHALQLDVSAGRRLGSEGPDWFAGAGFTVRF